MKKYGNSFDQVTKMRSTFDDICKIYKRCSNILCFIVCGIACTKYYSQRKNLESGGIVFFNLRDTHERFLMESKMFDSFIADSSYPKDIYNIIRVMLSDCHQQIPSFMKNFMIKDTVSVIQTYLGKSIETFSFENFVRTIGKCNIFFFKNATSSLDSYKISTFPALFNKFNITPMATTSTTTHETPELDDNENTETPFESQTKENSDFDELDQIINQVEMDNMEFKQSEEVSIIKKGNRENQYNNQSQQSDKMEPTTRLHTTHHISGLKECFSIYTLSKMSTSDYTNNNISNSSYNSHLRETNEYNIPDYCFIDASTFLCIDIIASCISQLFINNKKQITEDSLFDTWSSVLMCQYRIVYGALRFVTSSTLNIDATKGKSDTKNTTSNNEESLFFKNLMCDASISKYKSIVFTTTYGGRSDSFKDLLDKHGFNRSTKSKSFHIFNVEEISSIDSVPMNTFSPPYSNIILDSMHCWSIKEIKSVFVAIMKGNLIIKSQCAGVKMWLLSNANTVKGFGYDIVRDISRFSIILSEEQERKNQKLDENSGVSNDDVTRRRRMLFSAISKEDETFDETSRLEMWTKNVERFSFFDFDSVHNDDNNEIDERVVNEKNQKFDATNSPKNEDFHTLSHSTGNSKNNSSNFGNTPKKKAKITLYRWGYKTKLSYDNYDRETTSDHSNKQNRSLMSKEYRHLFYEILKRKFRDKKVCVIYGDKNTILKTQGDHKRKRDSAKNMDTLSIAKDGKSNQQNTPFNKEIFIRERNTIQEIDNNIKSLTHSDSFLIDFYKWCCYKHSIETDKDSSSNSTNNQLGHSIYQNNNASNDQDINSNKIHLKESFDAIFFLSTCGLKLCNDNMCFALNRAIELCRGDIYFDSSPDETYNQYVNTSQDDSSKGRNSIKTTFIPFSTRNGGKTSILVEKIMEKIRHIKNTQTN